MISPASARSWPETPCSRPEITRRLLDRFVTRPSRPTGIPPDFADLSAREPEVLPLIAHGRSTAEIAVDHFVTEVTVNTYVTHILTKLRLRDRVQAVALAYRTGLMDSDPERHRSV
jgi:DNA-binding NarL/FixJ family response regulator